MQTGLLRIGLSLVAFVLTVVLCPQISLADAVTHIPVEEVEVTTPVYHANMADFKPPLGEYEYSVTWQGIGAARLKVNINKVGMHYHVQAVAKTNSFIDIFYKLRYTAKGLLSAVDLLPLHTSIDSKENSKHKKSEVNFLPDGTIRSAYFRNGVGTTTKAFDPGNFMLDPISAAFLARSLDWEVGETREFDTFNGKSRYLISLTALEKTTMKVNDEERPVWVISPKVEKLTSRNAKKKLREAKIYVTADEKREILQIVSSVFIGSVKTRLEEFTPLAGPAPGTRVAAAPRATKIHLN